MFTARSRRHPVLLGSFIVSILFAATHLAAQPDPLDAVRARFAPDHRLTVFDVRMERQADAIVLRGEVESAAARTAVVEAIATAHAQRVVDDINVLPDPKLGAETDAVVRVSVANVRGKPAHSAEMVTQTLLGWPVRVLKEQGGWYLVHTEPDNYLGWIEELQLARMTRADRAAWDASDLAIVVAPQTFVRETPDANAAPVADLVIGALVKSISTTGHWSKVLLPDDRTGYVAADTVRDLKAWRAAVHPSADGFARTASLFTGAPYLWGGTSSKGFDCSGFAKTVLHLNGIELPRDTDQQAEVGEAVPLDEKLEALRPGDLLFFGTPAANGRPERISHVGIHLGHLEFIHASGFVRRSSLDAASPIYSESLRARLLRARRVLPTRGITE